MDVITTSEEGNGGAIKCMGKLYLENSKFIKNFTASIVAYGNSNIINCSFENQPNSFLGEKILTYPLSNQTSTTVVQLV